MLEALGIAPPERIRPEVGAVATALLQQLPASVDKLIRASGLQTHRVGAALAELELAGVAAEGDGFYRGQNQI